MSTCGVRPFAMSRMPLWTVSISAAVRLKFGRLRPSITPRAYSVFSSSVMPDESGEAAADGAGEGAGEASGGAWAAAYAPTTANDRPRAIAMERDDIFMMVLSLASEDPEEQRDDHAQQE